MDTFYVQEWFSYPWYRRWPWGSRSGTGRGVGCMLGEFQSITEAQVAELTALGRN